MSYYLHHTPGRLRIRIPQVKHRPYMAKRVQELFGNRHDVSGVEVNTTTGSVKIHYDPEMIHGEQLLNYLKYYDLFDEKAVIDPAVHIRQTGRKAGAALGKAAFSWVVGRVLEANGLSLLAAFI